MGGQEGQTLVGFFLENLEKERTNRLAGVVGTPRTKPANRTEYPVWGGGEGLLARFHALEMEESCCATTKLA